MLFFWYLVHISFQIHISTVLSTRCCPPLDQSSFSFSSLQQCARRVSCVVVANRQTLACHLIFLKRALLCICTLQNLHISQRAWCICTLENVIFLNVHYAFSHLKFYIFPMCTMYFNTGKVHIFQHARCICTLENFVFPNMHALVAHFIFLRCSFCICTIEDFMFFKHVSCNSILHIINLHTFVQDKFMNRYNLQLHTL